MSLIARSKARAHFTEMSDHAGVRSAWDKRVVATLGKTQNFAAADFLSEGGPSTNPQRSTAKQVGIDERLQVERPSSGSAPTSAPKAMRVQSPPAGLNSVGIEPAGNGFGLIEERLEQILQPLIERARGSRNRRLSHLSQTPLASNESTRGPRPTTETARSEDRAEAPLTGLRRLAASGMNGGDVALVKDDTKNIFKGERAPVGLAEPESSLIARSEDPEFASQLAEFFRSEALRHGIALERV
jgi:hypothetical protein